MNWILYVHYYIHLNIELCTHAQRLKKSNETKPQWLLVASDCATLLLRQWPKKLKKHEEIQTNTRNSISTPWVLQSPSERCRRKGQGSFVAAKRINLALPWRHVTVARYNSNRMKWKLQGTRHHHLTQFPRTFFPLSLCCNNTHCHPFVLSQSSFQGHHHLLPRSHQLLPRCLHHHHCLHFSAAAGCQQSDHHERNGRLD